MGYKLFKVRSYLSEKSVNPRKQGMRAHAVCVRGCVFQPSVDPSGGETSEPPPLRQRKHVHFVPWSTYLHTYVLTGQDMAGCLITSLQRRASVKKAIGYIRVSTGGQVESGASLDAQKAKIEAWCALNDYTLAEVFTDRGLSGKRMDNRAGLRQALASVEKGAALVVYSLSRLARSTKDAIAISELLSNRGADLVSLSEQLDTRSAAGKMIYRLLSVLAEFERDLISERTRAVLSYKRANGEKYSPLPYGFAEEGGRLVELADEAQVVAEILAMREGGHTLTAIADTLNARGVLGKRKGKWWAATIKYLIRRQGSLPGAAAAAV